METKLQNWKLAFKDKVIPCKVPGDITVDLFNAGIIEDPYFGTNHLEQTWVSHEEFDYINEINVTKEMLENDSIEVTFKGIDLFSEVFINEISLGKTENMFRAFSFELKPFLKEGKNILRVHMVGTYKELTKYDASKYVGCFNKERLLIRKAQCHFGWDWAPHICAFGIWDDVILSVGGNEKLISAHYFANDKGDCTIFAEVNYSLRPTYAPGAIIAKEATPFKGDKLIFSLEKEPGTGEYLTKEVVLDAQKSFVNFHLDDAKLWWPRGYGDHLLYNYKVELFRDGKVVSTKSGRVGFRSVELHENQIGDFALSHTITINGREIYVKGSNWVPIECFTGVVEDKKYKRLIDLAVNAGFNMLRVWGGGIYEKDIFYDYCDEVGIMTWQDLCLACGDIPDDVPTWVDNMQKEVEYQVKRLRVHPSLVYWCGGNEKTGTFSREITRGDNFVNYVLPGLVACYDGTRPFKTMSPCSYTDVPNDLTSGECHYGNAEATLEKGVLALRGLVAQNVVNFVGESACMGPSTIQTIKKFIPEDKLWPLNEVWNDRLMDNPYAVIKMDFAHREEFYAKQVGEVKTFEQFIYRAQLVHMEYIKCEYDWSRAFKERTSGWMNWMYTDIWPQSTWAIVDYYCDPKPAYYAQKRSSAMIYASFVEDKDKKTIGYIVNDKYENYSGSVKFEVKTFDGKILHETALEVKNLFNSVIRKPIEFDTDRFDIYLVATYVVDGKEVKNYYSPKMWVKQEFESNYEVKKTQITDKLAEVEIKANAFTKMVYLSMKDNYKFTYSDNYFDVEKGASVKVTVTCEEPFDVNEMVVTDYGKETK